MAHKYSLKDFLRPGPWVEQHGGEMFKTVGAVNWMIRQHKQELVDSGELIIRRGPGGTWLGPGFGRIALEIIRRESRGQAVSA